MDNLDTIRLGSIFYRPLAPELGSYKNENTWAFSYEKWDKKTCTFSLIEEIFTTKEECEKAFNKLKTKQMMDAMRHNKKFDDEAELEKIQSEKFMQDEIIKIKQNKETADYIAEHGIYNEEGSL